MKNPGWSTGEGNPCDWAFGMEEEAYFFTGGLPFSFCIYAQWLKAFLGMTLFYVMAEFPSILINE